ncbi:RIIa domain-containing protein 1 isoform X2 [Betta splendens]|uniref:RIIa domain-containing protein 1 isoform X2 n=1 Tax=Betta splendens TaxID=158456 RepID=A0A6P7KUD3_BETSP|nr:RIIa domain-containing protein 1 isoform X2 [Betta splendens]
MMSAQRGSTKLDVGVLSAEQREKLRQFKIATRIDNEEYLKSHPEVQLLIGDFLRCFLKGLMTSVSLLQITSPTQTFVQPMTLKEK